MESKNSDILSLLGIKIENQKIDIDLNKTKNVFENLQKTLEKKSEELNNSIKEGKVNLEDSVGLKVDNEHISLDLNKTKNFFENLTKTVDNFSKELDSSIGNLFKDAHK